MTFGFVIEGRSAEELPECLVGATRLFYPPQTIRSDDFFQDNTKSREVKEEEEGLMKTEDGQVEVETEASSSSCFDTAEAIFPTIMSGLFWFTESDYATMEDRSSKE